ncbi:MAG: hypothetical protein K8T25_05575 [Planctomycetia bacterium]|nr:hypothetical protein [Planctomycetia bacterium]
MPQPNFQFTLRTIFWATFLAAAGAAAWVCFARCLPPRGPLVLVALLTYIAGWAFQCGAVGAIFRRTLGGMLAGLVLGVLAFPVALFIFSLPAK